MKHLVKTFKALSDETKIRILKILEERDELCVCEIMQALDISQSRASRNLGILREAGLVKDRREGTWIYYSLSPEKGAQYSQPLLQLLDDWLVDDAVVQADRERLRKAVKLSLCQR
jgi:ArsR family transcriptional regulator